MKQHEFESAYSQEWRAIEFTMDSMERTILRRRSTADTHQIDNFPADYRRLCTQLALARERHYSVTLIDYLSRLALRGHQRLHRPPIGRLNSLLQFFARDFPQLVRSESALCGICGLMFFGPLLIMGLVIYLSPTLIYSLFDSATVHSFEELYRPGTRIDSQRPAASNVYMFGFYIYNNIGIGFRTFAFGLLFGIGAIGILVFNGVFIGATAGYLSALGYVSTFYPFVIAHGAFELCAIVLAGVAGMRMGLALLAPGRLSRPQAVIIAARSSIKIIYGVMAFLVIAAFLEAFWSSKDHLPQIIRYAVGAALWVTVICYLAFAGRRDHPPQTTPG